MDNTEMQAIRKQLDRIECATIIASKSILNLDEVSQYTGFTKGTIYGLTSKGAIPHAKRGGRLFFNKSDIEQWLMKDRITTQDEINQKASTYIAKQRIFK